MWGHSNPKRRFVIDRITNHPRQTFTGESTVDNMQQVHVEDRRQRSSRGSSPTLSACAPWSHGRWSIKWMIAMVKFMVNVKIRLVIVLRQRRTDYTGPSD
jgi:hypothetical protein